MSSQGELTQQQQTAVLWESLQRFATLPEWLTAARDPDQVCSALMQAVPEFASRGLILERCDIGHMRFKAEVWTGNYKLMVGEPGELETRIIPLKGTASPPGKPASGPARVEGSPGSDGWRIYLPALNLELVSAESESVLASLALLTDPQEACSFLEQGIGKNSAYGGISIRACNPRVVRYHPGARCTILYDMDYGEHQGPNGRWPDLVIAKTYRGEKGRNAYDVMSALWDSPLASGKIVKIAEPLAYNAEMKVLLQGPIPEEQTLKEQVIWAAFSESAEALAAAGESMKKTASGLAALHASGVRSDRLWTWENEMEEVRERIERLAEPVPGIAHAADPLLQRLSEMAQSTPADPLVPSHGSFRPAQVLLSQGQIGFIDFDSFCLSEPALDLAQFISTVKLLGLDTSEFEGDNNAPPLDGPALINHLERMLALNEIFLAGYEHLMPVSRQRVALWETLNLVMLVLGGWIKVKPFQLQECMYLLEDHLHRMGI